ncbi:Alpha/beta hydrolase fold-1 [Penicillium argentinense]|uniref:Alpha/beta hydrolase fold-1 n=1 Tax=Penicillium argentinense TaxID=1131581 RepID=A0A9W9KN68_9EURO|nr:Alpha/beta hydrolase fold-1 [Penicillium argentinense]KAJ5112305.1 Alpha/beta hydrolase fold-1 [Penicillium argentinense]
MSAPTPFTISVSDAQLEQLRHKLELATFPDEIDAIGWDMGVPLEEIKRLTNVWREKFDWRAQEKELNEELSHFTVPISVDGFGELEIHTVHQRSGNSNAIPLLFIHGWPGNFLEATKLIPLLTKNENGPAFDVIVPSLPNFGFSEGVKKKGFGLAQYAETLHKVMIALGYEEYVIQGGDWGSMIARTMSQYYARHIQAIHLNFVPVKPPYPWKSPVRFLQSLTSVPFSGKDRAWIGRTMDYLLRGNAYYKQQETRPQTLGYGLSDSPVGLLAWIYDKMHLWTDAYPWTDDEILTWVSVYYFSRAGPTASTRIYYEASAPKIDASTIEAENGEAVTKYMSLDQLLSASAPFNVRFAVAQFPKEIMMWPMAWYHTIGNVVKEKEFDRGGHFAAWEVPELLAGDLKQFFGRDGPAYGAVQGKEGY